MKTLIKNEAQDRHVAKIRRLKLSAVEKQTLEMLFTNPISFMANDYFHRPSVMTEVMSRRVEIPPGTTPKRETEETLFLQMNYARLRLGQIIRKLRRTNSWPRDLILELLDWYHQQRESRSKIVSGNMGLVLAMAKRVDYPGVEFGDLISEGSMALLRGTDKFDCSRGFKFSTYACRAILKSFSRAAKQSYRYRSRFPTQLEANMEKNNHAENLREEIHNDWVDEVRSIMRDNMADLSEIEESVVRLRFSLDEELWKPLTLKEVGHRLGLTKERIRQIQNNALVKLRDVTEERMAW